MSDPHAAEREVADLLLGLFGPMPTVAVDPHKRFDDDDDDDGSPIPVELPPPEPARRAAAERHVAALVEALARARDDAARAAGIARIEGALALLTHTGCIPLDQLDVWRSRVADVVPPPTPVAEDERLAPRSWPARGELRAIVPPPLARHDGMCVLLVRISKHATELDWHLVHRGRMRFVDAHAIAASFTLEDDVGTDYGALAGGAGWGGTAHGGPYAVDGCSRTDTPVPPGAQRLTVVRGLVHWDVPLTGL